MNIVDGWLSQAKRVISPNFDTRPDQDDISLIVLHCISLPPGQFGGDWIDRLFTNTLPKDAHPYFGTIHQFRVSAHALIRRTGQIVQYVPFHKRAWHAGESVYAGRARCNDFSIGLEMEGVEDMPYESDQYERLAALIGTLLNHYPELSRERIVGHSDVAPGRKTDPGVSFDWPRLWHLIERQTGSF
jgi:AmpD protein